MQRPDPDVVQAAGELLQRLIDEEDSGMRCVLRYDPEIDKWESFGPWPTAVAQARLNNMKAGTAKFPDLANLVYVLAVHRGR